VLDLSAIANPMFKLKVSCTHNLLHNATVKHVHS
jgi:hypothetical protein